MTTFSLCVRVCLAGMLARLPGPPERGPHRFHPGDRDLRRQRVARAGVSQRSRLRCGRRREGNRHRLSVTADQAAADVVGQCRGAQMRSEEHTSELQSLMRISYAVFCLKKNKQAINK